MRDIFNWDRTTINFFRYVSTSKVPDKAAVWAGRHVVIYLPRDGRMDPPFLEKEFIVSHMLPDELARTPFGEPEAGRDIYKVPGLTRDQAKTAAHGLIYSDPVRPFYMRDLRGQRIFTGKTLEERVANLEWLMGLAYQALEKLIGWYYKVKRSRRRVSR